MGDVSSNGIPRIVAISDDLTGSLGLAMLFANENLPVRALTGGDYREIPDSGVVVVNTESRALGDDEARSAVGAVMRVIPPDTPVVKRFDTTLRGNLAVELAAVLEARPDAAVLVVASYPASGRLCVGGYQLIQGVPLERTEVAFDPRWPISTSYVPSYFADLGPVHHVPLDVVSAGVEAVVDALRRHGSPGNVVVVDAFSEADLVTIARAWIAADRSFVLASPGAFLSVALSLRYRPTEHRVTVAAIGSTTDQTRAQIAMLEQKYNVDYLELPISEIRGGSVHDAVRDYLGTGRHGDCDVVVIRPEPMRADDLQERIVRAIAEAVRLVRDSLQDRLAGLILSGGETATAVLKQLECRTIRPEIEFGSLVMGGTMLDGALEGTRLVTKGGLVGDQAILLRTLIWFLKESRNDR